MIKVQFFRKHEDLELNIKDLAFYKIKKPFFTILVFYEKAIATRGHLNYYESFSILAFPISTAWNIEDINSIEKGLIECGVEYYFPSKPKNIEDYVLE